MMKLSYGAMLAWQVAARETVAGGHKLIGREHLLIGVCSLIDKMDKCCIIGTWPNENFN